MAEYFTSSKKTLFDYWQDKSRSLRFLDGGTREEAYSYFCLNCHPKFPWLDIGSGTGYVIKKCLGNILGQLIIAVDISFEMLIRYQVPEVNKIIASGEFLPLRKKSIAFTSSFFCLSDYPRLSLFSNSIQRILIDVGEVILFDYAVGDGYWELRKAHHDPQKLIGNINLRTAEDINKEFSDLSSLQEKYITSTVSTKNLMRKFDFLPETLDRKFLFIHLKRR